MYMYILVHVQRLLYANFGIRTGFGGHLTEKTVFGIRPHVHPLETLISSDDKATARVQLSTPSIETEAHEIRHSAIVVYHVGSVRGALDPEQAH